MEDNVKKRGRPKGSKNKSTIAKAELLVAAEKAKSKAKASPHHNPDGTFKKGNTAHLQSRGTAKASTRLLKEKAREMTMEMLEELKVLALSPAQVDDKGKTFYIPEKLPAIKEIIYTGHGKYGVRKDNEEQNIAPVIDREEVIKKLKDTLKDV